MVGNTINRSRTVAINCNLVVAKWQSLCDPRTPTGRGIDRLQTRIEPNIEMHEFTAEFLRLCEITVDGSLRHSLVAANLHYMTKVLTKIGLDREAVGEPEGLERTFANQSKELMFITQDAVRSRLRKLF